MIVHRTEQTRITESRVIGRQRVSALVALTFLEVIQASDRPFEVFEEEDTSITMPRRLGLSGVVERRIRDYQAETKKGRKIAARKSKAQNGRRSFYAAEKSLAKKAKKRSTIKPELIVKFVRKNEGCNMTDIEGHTNLPQATIRRVLNSAREAGDIRTEGQRRGLRYFVGSAASVTSGDDASSN